MKKVILYGIANCDTVKKAMAWLAKNNNTVQFHDYKKEGINKAKLETWCGMVGWEVLCNKKSTTWRELHKVEQDKLTNQSAAIKIMLTHHSIIKRPVIEYKGKIMVGFNEAAYQKALK